MEGRDKRRNVSVRLGEVELRAVKLEAMRRLESGESDRFDMSAVVRDALDRFLRPGGQEG